jgi:hypothetical protein
MRHAATACTGFFVVLAASFAPAQPQPGQGAAAERRVLPGGELQILGPGGGGVQSSCPLKHTDVVANVEPGAQVTIEIAYVETPKFEDGWYEFSFPMVVGLV